MSTDPLTMSLDGSTPAGVRPVAATLRVVAPSELRAGAAVLGAAMTLGRQPGAGALTVPHPTVSRRHAEVTIGVGGQHVVRDLGSRHGTKVDGRALSVAPEALTDGAILRLGDVFLAYEVGERGDADAVDRDALPGDAPVMAALRVQVDRAAPDRAPVLIIGDTGTGKEWVAGELHRLSGRRGPLVAVNCATLTAQLAESQLFGHAKGAFTGATADHDGWFRQAHGGTLFLDEIGELPLELQAKLLRTVQDGSVQPLGATRAVTVDVRLCAATNRDLAVEIERGGFRRDLHARLAKFELRVPALVARRGDVLAWIERMWRAWFRARDRAAPALTWRPDAVAALLAFAWPDNLRGVDRLVHDLALRHPGTRPIDVDDLPRWLVAPSTGPTPVAAGASGPIAVAPIAAAPKPGVPSKDEFLATWERLGRSVRAVARHYDRDRRQIYRWLTAHGVRVPEEE